jgi:hypothetical protein
LIVRTPDAAMSIGYVILLPLTFMSNVVVEPDAIALTALLAANRAAVPTPDVARARAARSPSTSRCNARALGETTRRRGVDRRCRSFDARRCRVSQVRVGLLVRLEAREGREADVERFLEGGLALVEEEPETIAWFAIRLGPKSFGIFDAFRDDDGRRAHLAGAVATALGEHADELLSRAPTMEPVDVLAAKVPA